MDLKICSYNCCSLNKNIDIVRSLTSSNLDIIFLQETFVTDEKLGILDFVDERYNCIGAGAYFSNKCLAEATGRPMGGLACLWRSDATFSVNVLDISLDYIALKLKFNNTSIILVNVYLRSDLGDPVSLEKFISGLIQLENILNDYDCENIFYCGDFNTDPFIGGRSWSNLKNFIERNDLNCYDINILGEDTITHMNYGTSQCRWLDHIIGRSTGDIVMTNLNVLYDLIGSDHLPVVAHVSVPTINGSVNASHTVIDEICIDWNNLSQNQINEIDRSAVEIQGSFRNKLNLVCTNFGCQNINCIKNIDSMYLLLKNSIVVSSNKFLKRRVKKDKYKVIPGWNRRVKSLHKSAREHYLTWLRNGKARTGIDFDRMNESRKNFKLELKNCRKNECDEISQSIQQKFENKSMKEFWSAVRNKKSISSLCLRHSSVLLRRTESRNVYFIIVHC